VPKISLSGSVPQSRAEDDFLLSSQAMQLDHAMGRVALSRGLEVSLHPLMDDFNAIEHELDNIKTCVYTP